MVWPQVLRLVQEVRTISEHVNLIVKLRTILNLRKEGIRYGYHYFCKYITKDLS